MRRREFIGLLGTGAAAASWPLPARSQQAMPSIGFLSSRSPGESAGVVAAFRQGLSETGFTEGQNLAIAFRWAEGRYDRLPALAAELVGLKVAVLYSAGGPPAALAAKAATSVIPIVFAAANDPVELGLVTSLNRPGGNVTGMSLFASDLWAKDVELLKELVPDASVMAYLINPSSPSVATYLKGAAQAASVTNIDIRPLNASTEHEIDEAMPPDVVTKLNTEMNAILQMPDVKQRFADQGVTPVGGPPQLFADHIKAEIEKWAGVVKDAKIPQQE